MFTLLAAVINTTGIVEEAVFSALRSLISFILTIITQFNNNAQNVILCIKEHDPNWVQVCVYFFTYCPRQPICVRMPILKATTRCRYVENLARQVRSTRFLNDFLICNFAANAGLDIKLVNFSRKCKSHLYGNSCKHVCNAFTRLTGPILKRNKNKLNSAQSVVTSVPDYSFQSLGLGLILKKFNVWAHLTV